MINTFYFNHDYNARNNKKILELRSKYGWEGYGIFFAILESMAESSSGKLSRMAIGGLSLGYGVANDWLLGFLDFCFELNLFQFDSESFWNNRILDHKNKRALLSEKGKIGALKKWENVRKKSLPIKEKNKKISCVFDFELIWSKYPKPIGVKMARKHFNVSVKTEKDFEDIKIALLNYLGSWEVKQGYIQNGSTWFNNWRDWINFSYIEPEKEKNPFDAVREKYEKMEAEKNAINNDQPNIEDEFDY